MAGTILCHARITCTTVSGYIRRIYEKKRVLITCATVSENIQRIYSKRITCASVSGNIRIFMAGGSQLAAGTHLPTALLVHAAASLRQQQGQGGEPGTKSLHIILNFVQNGSASSAAARQCCWPPTHGGWCEPAAGAGATQAATVMAGETATEAASTATAGTDRSQERTDRDSSSCTDT